MSEYCNMEMLLLVPYLSDLLLMFRRRAVAMTTMF
jgi:hypothetical protein